MGRAPTITAQTPFSSTLIGRANIVAFRLGEGMATDFLAIIFIIEIILIVTIIPFYIIRRSKVTKDVEPVNQKQYSGIAREPDKLSEPNEDAIRELEKLIDKLS